ncbi:MAG: tetratricopeptide repeat protein, partial [Deltaproteobacteria bacterium]|nr:tetratricopeptide repeat protein [Deltaproteobacteria bacterium]
MSMRGIALKVVALLVCMLLFSVVEAYCASSKTYYRQGNRYFIKKKYDRAIEKYEKAIEIKPNVA